MASILVIDDDHGVLTTVRILLERGKHDVTVADEGKKGLELLQTARFDLIMVDIFMPGMDGLETMSLVHRRRPELPIIVMSGHQFQSGSYPPPDFLGMATRLGAVRGLRKPFKPRELLGAVADCLPGAREAVL